MALSPTITPFVAPRLTSAEVELARAVGRLRAPLAVGGYQVGFGPQAAVLDPVCLDMKIAGAGAVATVPRGLHGTVLAMLDPEAHAAPADLLALLLDLALEPVLDALQSAAPGLAVAFGSADVSPDAAVALGLTVAFGETTSAIRLDVGETAAREIARLVTMLPTRRQRRPDIPVPLGVRHSVAELTLAELRAIGAGDVVLGETLEPGEVLMVAGERMVWRAQREGRLVRLLSARLLPRAAGLGDWVMQGNGGADEDAGLEELPVRLAFEVGRLEIPLGELETIGPGHVFELGRDPGECVDIIANGRRIGRGRLVEVSGAIGVQVAWIGTHG